MKLIPTPPLKRSFWMESTDFDAAISPTLRGNHDVDVLIIGGGFVGLWTALTVKQWEPDARVMVLEQDVCGGGASGRNGGFVMSWWPKIGTLRSFCDEQQTRFLGQSAERAIHELGEFCEEHRIDAHFQQNGWLWTATSEQHIDTWNGTLAACERLGVQPFERLDAAEVARRTGSSVHLAGVFERSNATVQPALLARGMRRVALAQGVEVHERSAVTRIEPGQPTTVHTAHGVVRARDLVLATNAWAAQLPELAQLIVPVNSSIVVTEAMPARLASAGWAGGESITDSQLMVDYYRTTRDGRIAFGKGTGAIAYGSRIGPLFSDDRASLELTKADLRRTYPDFEDVGLAHGWSGPIDRTYDSLPVFGSLGGQRNIHYGIGWSGNGVGPSRLGGRILASMALGRDDEWSRCPLVERRCRRFPPEPLRYLGGSLVRNAVLRKERAEMGGGVVSGVDRFLAGFAPAGLEDKA
ncbi:MULTISPECIES: NAD(P)/FAD-dependent oxidoreductase [Pseudomonadaceae]|jgi:glycine/D-amino acid oxidase-like deaminating enzyme|uniref:NAD(P)/FAD-dependent oxidoreductase n=1 Tax=Pseudomonadaceae TaxID=135621 RepID=UPI000C9CD8B5|nr:MULTISPECIES: FAD-binding oxidoreductase [Pseudomonadaceae]MCI1037277.1 FAD-dependent oxidoreductase [Pseudomonas putida]PNG82053.1 Gamma-glutamylputrescine oxidoreductase [Pseudomonas putida]UBT82251.1 FAD-dependent oxidoreductase [Pseudomonas amygdali]